MTCEMRTVTYETSELHSETRARLNCMCKGFSEHCMGGLEDLLTSEEPRICTFSYFVFPLPQACLVLLMYLLHSQGTDMIAILKEFVKGGRLDIDVSFRVLCASKVLFWPLTRLARQPCLLFTYRECKFWY